MTAIADFTIRERNVFTLPQSVRDVSHLGVGTQGKAIAVGEGIVLLVADPSLVDQLAEQLQHWLDEHTRQDPWARLNAAIRADTLEKVPNDRFIAPPEPERLPNLDYIAATYGDHEDVEQPKRRWRG